MDVNCKVHYKNQFIKIKDKRVGFKNKIPDTPISGVGLSKSTGK